MKILIVKLGALGDVLRTTPLLTALKKQYPGAEITWIVDPQHKGVLERNPDIHTLLAYSPELLKKIPQETYDLAVNLDKEDEALDCVMAAKALQKKGFGRDVQGKLCALDRQSDYAYRLGIDDELKFKLNQKSYQQISFEQLGLEFKKEEYVFNLEASFEREADEHLAKIGFDRKKIRGPVVGINTGSGPRFSGKKLPIEKIIEMIQKFYDQHHAAIFLLGGKDEMIRNREIERLCGRPVFNIGSHSIMFFAAVVRRCDLIISGDTTAMHIAIAMKVPVVTYFGSTCASEIELYGRGEKIVSTISCAPCYKRICPIDDQCMKDMEMDVILKHAKKYLAKTARV